ncbi:MAG: hypothetical protein IID55_02430, partial [Proteobacteria bacterium]|nr:hypothetical protein [Pseudomonadota bacterium]
MWLTLILMALLLGITLRQSMQGFFSALILAVLSICCAAGALGNYEWVAVNWVAPMF